MIRVFLLLALLAISPLTNSNNCCQSFLVLNDYGGETGFMYIRNYWTNRWVNCWIGNYHYQFQIPPNSNSRIYPFAPWGCG